MGLLFEQMLSLKLSSLDHLLAQTLLDSACWAIGQQQICGRRQACNLTIEGCPLALHSYPSFFCYGLINDTKDWDSVL